MSKLVVVNWICVSSFCDIDSLGSLLTVSRITYDTIMNYFCWQNFETLTDKFISFCFLKNFMPVMRLFEQDIFLNNLKKKYPKQRIQNILNGVLKILTIKNEISEYWIKLLFKLGADPNSTFENFIYRNEQLPFYAEIPIFFDLIAPTKYNSYNFNKNDLLRFYWADVSNCFVFEESSLKCYNDYEDFSNYSDEFVLNKGIYVIHELLVRNMILMKFDENKKIQERIHRLFHPNKKKLEFNKYCRYYDNRNKYFSEFDVDLSKYSDEFLVKNFSVMWMEIKELIERNVLRMNSFQNIEIREKLEQIITIVHSNNFNRVETLLSLFIDAGADVYYGIPGSYNCSFIEELEKFGSRKIIKKVYDKLITETCSIDGSEKSKSIKIIKKVYNKLITETP